MNSLAARLQRTWHPPPARDGIDMGGGVMMDAEDVLEGHARRLQSRRANKSAVNVGVQVDDDLVSAITVLAPDLAPLTELAEEVAEAVTPVHPTPQFRQHLHEALERTHRQYAAQRVLGTRPAPGRSQQFLWVPLLLGGAFLVLLAFWRIMHYMHDTGETS